MTADDAASVKLAYADPPYLGQADRYDHPDATAWDDVANHAALIARLHAEFDGWAPVGIVAFARAAAPVGT